jgi:hypothetical protein
VTRDAYRFEVPPVHLLRRGGTEAEPSLPVDFFREWFLTPLGGRLLASTIDGASRDLPPCDGRWFILRHGEATLTLCDELPSTVALDLRMLRTTPASSFEEFRFRGQSLRPHPGDRAEYEDRHSHVQASVDVESVDPAPPDPLAFVDPDRGDAR